MGSLSSHPNEILIHAAGLGCWLHFQEPVRLLVAWHANEVLPVLEELDRALIGSSLWAAGFLAYDAAPGLDQVLPARQGGDFPLAWFGLYPAPARRSANELFTPGGVSPRTLPWRASIDRQAYDAAIAIIKDHIARGDTYQVNYTFRLSAPFTGDPRPYFLELAGAQQALYSAYVNLDCFSLCSASPELFFTLDGETITSKPMKGTAPRGLTATQDLERADWLHRSEKNRAENVMIVDMVRNDIGKIARTGSVRVPELFAVEKYPTVWQMTSTVTGETAAPISAIFQALFPPASITGAPKARTMAIIRDLEAGPRRIYTGAIGFIAPGRRAQFNVAIRTVLVDRSTGVAEYGVGGGITWDSQAADEYEECQTKSRFLTVRRPGFALLESLLWAPEEGYFLLESHLERLAGSAVYFNYPLDQQAAWARLVGLSRGFDAGPYKVRLLLDERGRLSAEAERIPASQPGRLLTVGIAAGPVDATDPFLYHKTTHRQVFQQARATCLDPPDITWDDVLLWNGRGELTEATTANLVIELDGVWYTPPVKGGLLAGTYRGWLLEQGQIVERTLRLEDLLPGPPVYLVNSVRKLQPARVYLPGWLSAPAGRGAP